MIGDVKAAQRRWGRERLDRIKVRRIWWLLLCGGRKARCGKRF